MSIEETTNNYGDHETSSSYNEEDDEINSLITKVENIKVKKLNYICKKCQSICECSFVPYILYNNSIIHFNSIRSFNLSTKSNNDSNNKERENVIGAILNNKIPQSYYNLSKDWRNMKKELLICLKTNYIKCDEVCNKINRIEVLHKGGRKFNYDMNIIFHINEGEKISFNIEFKFNAKSINEAPQFVSPSKPSQYMTSNYEEYFYDNYMDKVLENTGLNKPDRNEYLNKIHGNAPTCMKEIKNKYKNDKEFEKKAKALSKESIVNFINNNDLNKAKIQQYLLDSQANKKYMLYYQGKFYYDELSIDNYMIIDSIKDPKYNRFICKTVNNKYITVLLRWKNGNGIAFPAFQIKLIHKLPKHLNVNW